MNRARRRFRWSSLLPWALFLVGIVLVVTQVKRPQALVHLWRPWAEIGILAIAMTPIVLTGGIDLSVGSMVALAGVTLGQLWQTRGWPIGAAAAASVATAVAAGAINGGLITAGIPPLVTTLATMALYAGLALAISGGQRVPGLPAEFCQWGQADWLSVPAQVWYLAAAIAIYTLWVHRSRWGRYVFALGDNRLAAQFAAVPVAPLEWSLYAQSGLVAGLVALTYTARNGAAVPDAGAGLELKTIAAIVVGGTRVTGGWGGIGQTVLGLLVLAHLDIGLQLAGSQQFPVPWSDATWRLTSDMRQVVVGLLVIGVAFWNERMSRRDAG